MDPEWIRGLSLHVCGQTWLYIIVLLRQWAARTKQKMLIMGVSVVKDFICNSVVKYTWRPECLLNTAAKSRDSNTGRYEWNCCCVLNSEMKKKTPQLLTIITATLTFFYMVRFGFASLVFGSDERPKFSIIIMIPTFGLDRCRLWVLFWVRGSSEVLNLIAQN